MVAVGGLVLCGILGMLLAFYAQWNRHRRAEVAAALQQQMLDREMSAGEIIAVLQAGGLDAPKPPPAPIGTGVPVSPVR